MKLRTRMAPSPTGKFNIGGAFGTLMVWLMAHRHEGDFVLRFEDTDKERSKKEFEDDILEGMKWLGLDHDEVFRQSENLETQQKYLKQLLDKGKAFYCAHTKEELEAEQKQQHQNKEAPRHICSHKGEDKTEGIVRLAVDHESKRKISFDDALRGHIEFEEGLFGDFSIARSIDSPLYLFANVVDDNDQGITHVIRGDDGISNVPRQILIQEALGFDAIEFTHYPMMLGENKKKLSKRDGALPIAEYRDMGYLPQAIINYLALMGFTPDEKEEIFAMDELAKRFEVKKIHKSPSVLDLKKLDWVNAQHIKQLSDNDLLSLVGDKITQAFGQQDDEYLKKVIPLMRERMNKFSEAGEFDYFFGEPEYEAELLKWKKAELADAGKSLEQTKEIIDQGFDNGDELRKKLDELGERLQDRGLVYWPLRVALTGKKFSPDPVDIGMVLGRDTIIKRLDVAIAKING